MTARRIACFVTPHGFGHAARACAVLAAWHERMPLDVDLFTTVPEWFFRDSLPCAFTHHAVHSDVGLVQRDALDEDLAATVRALDAFLPWPPSIVEGLGTRLRERGCEAVLCDIAPLGVAAARAAGLPVALVESFTWDWIYEAYGERVPGLRRHAAELARWFAAADLRLQTVPVCRPWPGTVAVAPVARLPRRSRDEVRHELGIGPHQRAVLLTMGGIAWDYTGMVAGGGPRLPRGVVLVVPGGADEPRRLLDRDGLEVAAVLLPFRSTFFHPDLVAAADAVVGKLGYSTLAECWGSGVPFGFVPRESFPESPVLAAALAVEGAGVAVSAHELRSSSWEWLPRVLALRPRSEGRERGNAAAGDALSGWIEAR